MVGRRTWPLETDHGLAGEYMDCVSCQGTIISWDNRLLDQLPDAIRAKFPCVLTFKYACDRAVISLLRARTSGNSPSALQHNLGEIHSEKWLRKKVIYLSDCEHHQKFIKLFQQEEVEYDTATPLKTLPTAKWFLAVYVRDVWAQLPYLLAVCTSTYGSILKIDYTKKVCQKLQGFDVNSASWATNVGNEKGEIVQCVITASEASESLQSMANGLMERYANAGIEPPVLLYTDRDCCGNRKSKFNDLFCKWDKLYVHLDIWHFMWRLASACTTESHPLYGVLMGRLSACVLEWDSADYELLSAKKAEFIKSGVCPSDTAIRKLITKEELARHCWRKTRGAEETNALIEKLFLSLTSATGTLGVPILTKEVATVWEE